MTQIMVETVFVRDKYVATQGVLKLEHHIDHEFATNWNDIEIIWYHTFHCVCTEGAMDIVDYIENIFSEVISALRTTDGAMYDVGYIDGFDVKIETFIITYNDVITADAKSASKDKIGRSAEELLPN